MRATHLALCWVLVGSLGQASEVQRHGVVFEQWIRDTFFDHYQPPSYTQKWDIPAEANVRYGRVPVNPKATEYGTPVGLGDALRQFEINEPFMLIIGYWVEEGEQKRFVKVVAPVIQPEAYKKLWGQVTLADLQKLDALIKDRTKPYTEVRREAQAMKKSAPFNTAIFTLNPKIDSENQRRLQCSLGFHQVFQYLVPDEKPAPEVSPRLFNQVVPGPFDSPPRQFKKKTD
jgi:hypothetical protein